MIYQIKCVYSLFLGYSSNNDILRVNGDNLKKKKEEMNKKKKILRGRRKKRRKELKKMTANNINNMNK